MRGSSNLVLLQSGIVVILVCLPVSSESEILLLRPSPHGFSRLCLLIRSLTLSWSSFSYAPEVCSFLSPGPSRRLVVLSRLPLMQANHGFGSLDFPEIE